MDYREKIFKLLNVKPNEKFKIKEVQDRLFRINEHLELQIDTPQESWLKETNGLYYILTGIYTIEKFIDSTDQIVINYAKACGYNWLAKDEDESVCAYEQKPKRQKKFWNEGKRSMCINMPVNFLSWEDNEPYYIGN